MKRRIFLSILFAVISIATYAQVKYVFYFIGDGMGVNQVNITEMFEAEAKHGKISHVPLQFASFPHSGLVMTFSATNSVTDSSAAGTALSTGIKTYNGAIGLDEKGDRIESIAEKALRAGKRVGVATSVSVDHATPAAFYAHQAKRKMYYEIATDLPKSNFHFFAGSGFLSPNTTYKKEPATSVFELFDKGGYTVARGLEEYKAKRNKAEKMILIQKAEKEQSSLPYAIDREKDDLTLAQITSSAIDFLTKGNNKGFFLMVEGGKIDWACHDNDAATSIEEVKDLDEAVKVALDFYKKHPKETLIVITADHETGGISLGTGGYQLNLKALKYQKKSTGELSKEISKLRKEKNNKVSWEDIKELLAENMGFWKNIPITWEQEKKLRDEFEKSFVKNKVVFEKSMYTRSEPVAACAKEIMSEIAMVSWASNDHSAGYVPVFAIGKGAEMFNGRIDNTEIPKRIAKLAGYK